MIYLAGLVTFLLAFARIVKALNQDRTLLLERGASAGACTFLKLSLWLFLIPPIAQVIPFRLIGTPGHPIPLALTLFIPGIVAAIRLRRALPPGGYDYQVRAADNVVEILWLSAGGAGLVLISTIWIWLLPTK